MVEQRYEHGYAAMKATFDGLSSKEIALAMIDSGLWDMRLDSAAARVRNCMHPESDQFFKLSDLLFLMWHFQRFELLYHCCDVLHHSRPALIAPNTERAKILEEMLQKQTEYEELRAKYNALGSDKLPQPRFSVEVSHG